MGMSMYTTLIYGVHVAESDDMPEKFEDIEDFGEYLEDMFEADKTVDGHLEYYYDYANHFLVIGASKSQGDFSSPLKVSNLKDHPTWDKKLEAACKKLGVKYEKAHWMVVCSYG